MLEWRQAADDVHVAMIGREFAGYAAFVPAGVELRDAHDRRVGVFPTLTDAQDALRPVAPVQQHVTHRSRRRRDAPDRTRGPKTPKKDDGALVSAARRAR